ncbi:unnamed protein product, partial [Ostreobium quekettii]
MELRDSDAESDGGPEAVSLSAGRDVFLARRRLERESGKKNAAGGGGARHNAASDRGSGEERGGEGNGGGGEGVQDSVPNRLPDEVVKVMMARAARSTQRQGHSGQPRLFGKGNSGGMKRKRTAVTEVNKGPIVVKVLYGDAPPKAT